MRHTNFAFASLLAAALIAFDAHAQPTQQCTYVSTGPFAQTFQAMQSATTITGLGTSGAGASLTLPFPFEYYGSPVSTVTVHMHGYVEVNTGKNAYPSNQVLPHNSTSPPSVLIAPWWDQVNVTTGSAVRYKTEGTAPSRVFAIEWLNMCSGSTCGATRFSHRLELHEKAHRIRFVYGSGTSSPSASVGYMNGPGIGKAVLTCTPNCSSTSFPTNAYYEIALPPDPRVDSIAADDIAYAGVGIPVSVTLRNTGGQKAVDVFVRFYLSEDPFLDSNDVVIGDTAKVNIDYASSAVSTGVLTVPVGTTDGEYFLIDQVDPLGAIFEGTCPGVGEVNNVGTPSVFYVGPPTPDLLVTAISGPATAGAGATLNVDRTLNNVGNADATSATTLTWFISDNSVVTISDTVAGTETIPPLASGASVPGSSMVTLPASLRAGQYWIGACVDYDENAAPMGTLKEISEVNNCTTGTSFVLNSGALTILTSSLPAASQNSPYGLRLEAIGGNGVYAWTLESGTLPLGLALSPQGDLAGTPSDFGTSTFVVKVTSDGVEATKAYTLQVTDQNMPLAVVDQLLPTGEFGRGYSWQLVAVGGKAPYLWSLAKDSRLPLGLGLSPDGFIEGRPSETRVEPFPFTVEVKDSLGNKASRSLVLRVVKPPSMHIATSALLPAFLKKEYRMPLQAIGGTAPYAWSVVRFQKIAQTSTDVPGGEMPGIPDTFGIVVQPEGDNAVLRGMPTQAGLFVLTFYVQDFAGASDTTTLMLNISYDQGLAITTTVLPDAFVNQQYTVRLSHNAGAGVTVEFTEACVQRVVSKSSGFEYQCAPVDPLQKLPAGLTLDTSGTISGLPTAPEGQEASSDPGVEPPPVIHNFLVKVTDVSGRTDVRSLSIKVRTPATGDKGCSGTGLGPAGLALLALAGLARRRRS